MEKLWFSVDISIDNDFLKDILIASLFEMGATGVEDLDDSFFYTEDEVNEQKGLRAFFEESKDLGFIKKEIARVLRDLEINLEEKDLIINYIAKENWREKWKESYRPIEAGDFMVIPIWEKEKILSENKFSDKIKIYIEPQMAFGTGTHETTQMMLEILTTTELEDKMIMDAGTGSGILAIAAAKKGAAKIFGYDIEQESIENSTLNSKYNDQEISFQLVDEKTYQKENFYDLVLANINTNVLVSLMKDFVKVLKNEGILVLSGILIEEKQKIIQALDNSAKYKIVAYHEKNEWCSFKLRIVK